MTQKEGDVEAVQISIPLHHVPLTRRTWNVCRLSSKGGVSSGGIRAEMLQCRFGSVGEAYPGGGLAAVWLTIATS